jgi:hypothetical protein
MNFGKEISIFAMILIIAMAAFAAEPVPGYCTLPNQDQDREPVPALDKCRGVNIIVAANTAYLVALNNPADLRLRLRPRSTGSSMDGRHPCCMRAGRRGGSGLARSCRSSATRLWMTSTTTRPAGISAGRCGLSRRGCGV